MNPILLLGAGFSKNWGGWLADEITSYLLNSLEIRDNEEVKQIIWDNETSGFESALEQLQADAIADPKSALKTDRLHAMQRALTRMFAEMNEAFYETSEFESHPNRLGTVKEFLARFDTIFTLNQDLLLEHFYKDRFDLSLETPQRWGSIQIPGMRRIPPDDAMDFNSWARSKWEPLPDSEFEIDPKNQPYIKLHGSCNWINKDGNSVLIMGGNKRAAIRQHEILCRYASLFEDRLRQPNSRLMIIGYGFRDHHINKVIQKAVSENNLKLFIISPQGRSLASVFDSKVHSGLSVMMHGYDLPTIFRRSLMDVSVRPLREIFGVDLAERRRVQRFFEA